MPIHSRKNETTSHRPLLTICWCQCATDVWCQWTQSVLSAVNSDHWPCSVCFCHDSLLRTQMLDMEIKSFPSTNFCIERRINPREFTWSIQTKANLDNLDATNWWWLRVSTGLRLHSTPLHSEYMKSRWMMRDQQQVSLGPMSGVPKTCLTVQTPHKYTC